MTTEHRADGEAAPGPQRFAVPSLLRALLNDHLDPGYAARAAQKAAAGTGSAAAAERERRGLRWWLALGGLAIGAAIGVAWGNTSASASDTEQVRSALAEEASATRERVDALSAERAATVAAVDENRVTALGGDAGGRAVLEALRGAELLAGSVATQGPGLVVVLGEPTTGPDLSGSGRVDGARSTILDRDMQLVVNSLFAAGAEAISIGDVRIGPATAIRQAGGAILVDNQPVLAPYVVSAIGPVRQMQSSFVVSDAYIRMSAVSQLYGASFTVREEGNLVVPAGVLREQLLSEALPSGDPPQGAPPGEVGPR